MKINYIKKINGLCYVEGVLNENNQQVAKIIFDNNCKLIDDANEYLRELRITRTSSYNSINRIAYDLCYFYDFLVFSNSTVNDVDYELMSSFIEYLMKISKANREYSIEKTLLKSLNIENENKKVIKIRKFGAISDKSISRIFNRAIDYLEYLERKSKFNKKQLLDNLKTYRDKKRFVRANGVQVPSKFIDSIYNFKLITDNQMDLIKNYASRRNDYMRFLVFILEHTGIRIGELLGLKIISYKVENIRNIQGDIFYVDNTWKIRVCWDIDNPSDSLSKSRNTRIVSIAEKDKFEFESLLERYVKYRERILKAKNTVTEFLFISNQGTKLTYDTASKRFKRLVNIVCLEATYISFHNFRHTFATKRILEGYPLEFVALILGHSSPFTTYKTYVHYSGQDMKDVREKYSHYTERLLKMEGITHETYK